MKLNKYLISAVFSAALAGLCITGVCAEEITENNIVVCADEDFGLSETQETDTQPSDGWFTDENGKVFYLRNGEKLTGLCEIEGDTYLFAPNGAMKYGWFTTDYGRMFFDLETGKKLTGWISYMGHTFYADSTSGKLTGRHTIDGIDYIFDDDGILGEGWFEYNGCKYYSTMEEGVYTGERIIDGITYYFSPSGIFYSGWQNVNGLRIFYDYDSAAPLYGWIHYNGLVYYASAESGKYTGEHDIGGIKYRFADAGYMETGLQAFDDGTRYYYSDGTIASGFVEDGGNRYYFGDDHLMKTGFVTVDQDVYFFDPDGKMLTGWQDINDEKYYFDPDSGKMSIGIVRISGESYYFNEYGIMQTGFITVDENKYYFDTDGKMLLEWQTIGKNRYYFGNDGIMRIGLQNVAGKKYYFDQNGIMKTGWQIIDNQKYYFDSEGVMVTEWQTINGKKYYFGEDGVIKTGLQIINSKKYYFSSSGAMKTGWQTVENDKYFFTEDGSAAGNIYAVNGKKYYFDPKTHSLVCGKTLNGITTNSDGIVTKVLLETPYLSQSGYPTGCESASAVMLLRDAGYSTTIADFIDRALDIGYLYSDGYTLYGPDPNKAFIGDPRSSTGYGCYAPVITNALNRILNGGDKAENVTGTSLSKLIDKYIDNGTPVAIWATINMIEMEYTTQWIIPETGELFTWKSNEHCLVLVGYDDKYYYINDPYNSNGLMAYSRSVVEQRFTVMGSQAVVINKG